MRVTSIVSAVSALAFVAGCTTDQHPIAPMGEEPRLALITGIRIPASVSVNDDVIVRFSVVTGPCETPYYAQNYLDGQVMRVHAFKLSGPCVTSDATLHDLEFMLQGPQPAIRSLRFEEPDGADSLRQISVTGGQ